MLTAAGALVSDLGDAMARDPEVQQARVIAEAARTRLLACMAGPEDAVDVTEAQGMLNALRDAQLLAQDAEDRLLTHRGLLTPAEAQQRAALRRPAAALAARPRRTGARRPHRGLRVIACVLGLAALWTACAVLARRADVRLPLTRR